IKPSAKSTGVKTASSTTSDSKSVKQSRSATSTTTTTAAAAATTESAIPAPTRSEVVALLAKLKRGPRDEAVNTKLFKSGFRFFTGLEMAVGKSSAGRLMSSEDGVVDDLVERESLCDLAQILFTINPPLALKHEIDQRLWKTAFYSCIEKIRSVKASMIKLEQVPKSHIFESWEKLIDLGEVTFSKLIEDCKEFYRGGGDVKMQVKMPSPSLPMWSKMVVWMGDLVRYRISCLSGGGGGGGGGQGEDLEVDDGVVLRGKALKVSNTNKCQQFTHKLDKKYLRNTIINDSITVLFAANRKAYEKDLAAAAAAAANSRRRPPQGRRGGSSGSTWVESIESLFIRTFEVLHTKI
ncbi:hypothetical protein HDU76_010966, partial [Blyttiomyces sp. JEL0837]